MIAAKQGDPLRERVGTFLWSKHSRLTHLPGQNHWKLPKICWVKAQFRNMWELPKKRLSWKEKCWPKESLQGSNTHRRSLNSQMRRLKVTNGISKLKLSKITLYRWFKNQKKVVLAAKVKKAQKMIGLKDFLERLSNTPSSFYSRTWRPIDLNRRKGTLPHSKIPRSKMEKLMEIPRGCQKDDKIPKNLQTIMKSVLTKKMSIFWLDYKPNHLFWKESTNWDTTSWMVSTGWSACMKLV